MASMTCQLHRIIRLTAALLLPLSLLILAAGCKHNDTTCQRLSQKRIQQRNENLANTVTDLRKIEGYQAENMQWILHSLRQQYQNDAKNCAENPKRVRKMLEDDVRRWEENQPAYRREIERHLRGNPANIEQTVPYMLW